MSQAGLDIWSYLSVCGAVRFRGLSSARYPLMQKEMKKTALIFGTLLFFSCSHDPAHVRSVAPLMENHLSLI